MPSSKRLKHSPAPELHSLPPETLHDIVEMFKALSDYTRANIVYALTQGELCVGGIAAEVDASPSAVSHHLRRLRDSGLVSFHRHGNQVFYSIDDLHIKELIQQALNHIDHIREQISQLRNHTS